jgi:A/G-specific adenine glycosylase
VVAALEAWFPAAQRDLPWRRLRTPYTALVSEAMLQQTQVARVAERFPRFLARFPDLATLAAAPIEAVLEQWEGLGYYRRARHLHAAATRIVSEHGGQVPEAPKDLLRLPGVGRYTAGAIASIAFGHRAAIVDGNVMRVLLRLHGRPLASDDPAAIAWAWEESSRLVERANAPGVANEALMELGATVCTPAAPRCSDCPLAAACVAHRLGATASIPRPKTAPPRRRIDLHLLVAVRGDELLLRRRPEQGLWGGLWEPPSIEAPPRGGRAALASLLAIDPVRVVRVGAFDHLLTHRHVRIHVHRLAVEADLGLPSGWRWANPRQRSALPMSVPARRAIDRALDAAAPRPRRLSPPRSGAAESPPPSARSHPARRPESARRSPPRSTGS